MVPFARMPSPLPRQDRWKLVRSYDPISFGLPRSHGGSAPASLFSGPAQRSLTLRPARSPGRLCDPLHQRLQQSRCLHCCSDCYRVERTSFPGGYTPAVDQRLSRRTRERHYSGVGRRYMIWRTSSKRVTTLRASIVWRKSRFIYLPRSRFIPRVMVQHFGSRSCGTSRPIHPQEWAMESISQPHSNKMTLLLYLRSGTAEHFISKALLANHCLLSRDRLLDPNAVPTIRSIAKYIFLNLRTTHFL